MANGKYAKYILSEPHAEGRPQEPIWLDSSLNKEITCDIAFTVRTEPGQDGPPPHKHDADEYIFFLAAIQQTTLIFQRK